MVIEATRISEARAAIAAFSPRRPLMVHPNAFREIKESGYFDDLLDRVRVIQPIPRV